MQPNPFAEASPSIMPVQPTIVEMLYQRQGYLKKLVEEAVTHEETRRLFQFCSWENPQFSHLVLHELLWQVSIAYTHELRPHLDLLLQLLLIEDSWQTLRVQRALLGTVTDDGNGNGSLLRGEGLFDTIQKAKSHYQKRGYQCIKLLVALFTQCAVARQILDTNAEVRRRWGWSVDWLSDELEQRNRGLGGGAGGGGAAGAYGSWSPPAQSNETANGYFLERSHSAKVTLEKACELLPEEVSESVSC
jgi:ubiquitin carboxyl-terminal hydrolase 9/24